MKMVLLILSIVGLILLVPTVSGKSFTPELTETVVEYEIDSLYPLEHIDENCEMLQVNETLLTAKIDSKELNLDISQLALITLKSMPLKTPTETLYKDYSKDIVFCHNQIVGEYRWGFGSTNITVTNMSALINNYTGTGINNTLVLASTNQTLKFWMPAYADKTDFSFYSNADANVANPEFNSSCFNSSGCFEFETNEYFQYSDDDNLAVNQELTVMFWQKFDKKTPKQGGGLFKSNLSIGVADLSYSLFISINKSSLLVSNGSSTRQSPLSNIYNLDGWNHFTGTFNSTTICVYVNGIQNCTPSTLKGGIQNNDGSFWIGRSSTTGKFLNGSMKNIRVYNVSHNSDQIRNIIDIETANGYFPVAEAGTAITPVYNDTFTKINWTSTEPAGTDIGVSHQGRYINYTKWDSIRAYYFCDQILGGEVDRSPNNNDLAVTGGNPEVKIQNSLLRGNGYCSFDGDGSQLENKDIDYNLDGRVNLTVMYWAYFDTTPNDDTVFDFNNGVLECYHTSSTQMRCVTVGLSDNTILLSGTPKTGVWKHYTLRLNYTVGGTAVTKQLYINGSLEVTEQVTGNLSVLQNDFAIGEKEGGSRDLLGDVDEIIVFNKSLSATEIDEWYRGVHSNWTPRTPVNTTNPHSMTNDSTYRQFIFTLNTSDNTITPALESYTLSNDSVEAAPTADSATIAIFFSNTTHQTDYKTVFQPGENFKYWWNWSNSTGISITDTDGACNFTARDVVLEDESPNEDFTLCDAGQGCTFDNPHEEQFTLEASNISDDVIHDYVRLEICHAQVALRDLTVIAQCNGLTETITVDSTEFGLCADGYSEVVADVHICANLTTVNVSIDSNAPTFIQRHNISEWEWDRRVNNHTDTFGEGEIYYNTTVKLWSYTGSYERYNQGTSGLSVNCSHNTQSILDASQTEEITILAEVVTINIDEVTISPVTFNLSNGEDLENNGDEMNWMISIVVDNLGQVNYTFYNETGQQVLSNQSLTRLDLNSPPSFFKDGNYNLTVWANNTIGNKTYESINFSLTTLSPSVALRRPADNSRNTTTYTQVFACNFSDNYWLGNASLRLTDNLTLDWKINETVQLDGLSDGYNFTKTMQNGNFTWSCSVIDLLGNEVQGTNRSLMLNVTVVDFSPPNVTLNWPTYGRVISGTSTHFNCTGMDNQSDLSSASLYGNWSGTWEINATNTSTLTNATYVFNRGVTLPQGDFIWNCEICDIFSNCASFQNNYTFSVIYPGFNFLVEDWSIEWIKLNWT